MYTCDKYNVNIRIELENGLYIFNNQASIGKTRLCKTLKELRRLNEPVIGYTYGDDKLGIILTELILDVKPIVIMLDRYDMYNGEFNDKILEWAKYSIVLIDCKGDLNIAVNADWCTIEMGPQKIEVVQ